MSHIADLADHVNHAVLLDFHFQRAARHMDVHMRIGKSQAVCRTRRRAGAASGRQRISNASLVDLDLDIRPVKDI